MENKTKISKDAPNKKMMVTRSFAASLEQVWLAWTDSQLLDQWWAPEPWKARTRTMNFSEGGYWHYAMVGPDGTEIWARVDYLSIMLHRYFTAKDSFCDANAVANSDFPNMEWKNTFQKSSYGTDVTVEITFQNEADMQKIIEMGFEAGFTMAHGNLDKLLDRLSMTSL